MKGIIYWILYAIILGGGILFFGAVLVYDTFVELDKDYVLRDFTTLPIRHTWMIKFIENVAKVSVICLPLQQKNRI